MSPTIFHTQLCHIHTHNLSHTTLSHTIFHTPFFTQLCYTPFFAHHFSHTSSFTHNFVTHHFSSTSSFVFPSFPVPATTFLAYYWKKLTCGVIRSFYFSLGTRHAASASARRRVPHSSHLTHHSTTHHTSLITALLITPQSSQHYPSHLTHHTSLITALLITPLVNHTTLSCGRRSAEPPGEAAARVGAAGPRLAFVWQAQYTAPSGGAAARVVAGWPAWPAADFRAAGALCRAFWRSCCARGPRLALMARDWSSCGRRITQSLEELLRAWSPAGPRLAFVWQAQYTGSAGGAAAHVVAAWPAAGVRVAGAVHRAFWRSCCARGRLLASWLCKRPMG